MIGLSFLAAFLLPFAAAFTWRVSRYSSIALSIATLGAAYWIGSIMLHIRPWEGARWIVAGLTGCIGAACLGATVRDQKTWWDLVKSPGAQCEALLVGSSFADFVSLYREAHGGEFGALPILTIAVLLAMIWISRRAAPSESTPVPMRPEFFREWP